MKNLHPRKKLIGFLAAAVFSPHFLDGRVHFAHGVAECREGILQAIRAYLFT